MSVAATGIDRIAAAFASHGKRAALMPYLMGGYPSADASAEAGLAAAAAGADLIELGIPFSDPLADGPVIHSAATDALARGFVDEVLPRAALVSRTEEVARTLASRPAATVRAAKAAVWAAVDLPLAEGLRREQELAALAQSSP